MNWAVFAGWIAGAYLVGSIPVGYMIACARGIDIRELGSGNIGATNVARVLGWRAGGVCLALDMLKGIVPTLAYGLATGRAPDWERLSPLDVWLWTAIAAAVITGHMFPVWLRFKGGKGVATGFGALLGVFPVMTVAALGAMVVWLVSARISRQVGVSSCLAALSLPVWIYLAVTGAAKAGLLRHGSEQAGPHAGAHPLPDCLRAYLVMSAALALLVIWKHRGNIARTLAGTERKIGERVQVAPGDAAARR